MSSVPEYTEVQPEDFSCEDFEKKTTTDKKTKQKLEFFVAKGTRNDGFANFIGPKMYFPGGIQKKDKYQMTVEVKTTDTEGMKVVKLMNSSHDTLKKKVKAARKTLGPIVEDVDNKRIYPYPWRQKGEKKGQNKPDTDFRIYPKLQYFEERDEKTGEVTKVAKARTRTPEGKDIDWEDLMDVDVYGIPTFRLQKVYVADRMSDIWVISDVTVTDVKEKQQTDNQAGVKQKLKAENPDIENQLAAKLAAISVSKKSTAEKVKEANNDTTPAPSHNPTDAELDGTSKLKPKNNSPGRNKLSSALNSSSSSTEDEDAAAIAAFASST